MAHGNIRLLQHLNMQASADVSFWLQCIRRWYPDLNGRTYFLPPLHFNRVPYSEETVAGKKVLVRQQPNGASSQTSQSPQATPSCSYPQTAACLSVPRVYDNEVRDDCAQERIRLCLRAMAEIRDPPEVMMVVSQLYFGKYLNKPCYAAAADAFRPSRTLPFSQGDFDVLIIHRQFGLIIGEIKSVGANFKKLNQTEQEEDAVIVKTVKKAIKQLDKAETFLRTLVLDFPGIKITKTIMVPNIQSSRLYKAINNDLQVTTDLHQCLGVQDAWASVEMCLCSDRLSKSSTPWEVSDHEMQELCNWWNRLTAIHAPHATIDFTTYEQLVARFCGPATTVDVYCVTPPRLEMRSEGEGVSETGERMSRFALYPDQVDLLNRSPPRVFLVGPPGTGKTVVLILQGLNWLQRGQGVNILGAFRESLAVSVVIEHQLKKTFNALSGRRSCVSARVFRNQYDFQKKLSDVFNAVSMLMLTSIKHSAQVMKETGNMSQLGKLNVIADEVGPHDDSIEPFAIFCKQLVEDSEDKACIWAASIRSHTPPPGLQEVVLTMPLRSPPAVVREVERAPEIQKLNQVYRYTSNASFPHDTDGPKVIWITHRNGQKEHVGTAPEECGQCGKRVADTLKDLAIGIKDCSFSSSVPPLQYSDVLVLVDDPRENRGERNSQATASQVNGIVQGLRDSHVPVRVVEKNAGEAAIRATALAIKNEVTVTICDNVRGLEKKVVVVSGNKYLLHGMSRCSSQLILIDGIDFEGLMKDIS